MANTKVNTRQDNPVAGQTVILRSMTSIDIPSCKRLSSELGWAHRQDDWAQAFRTCVGAVLEDVHSPDNEIVGTALVCLGGERASTGLIIVRANYQSQGLGRRLMQWAVEVAGERSMTLLSTEEGLRLYEKMGFEEVGGVDQYQGVVKATAGSSGEKDNGTDGSLRPARYNDMPGTIGALSGCYRI